MACLTISNGIYDLGSVISNYTFLLSYGKLKLQICIAYLTTIFILYSDIK